MQRHIHKMIFMLALFALCAVGASRFVTMSVAGQETKTLHGAAALNQLKQDGQYDSLQAAMEQARLSVSRETATLLGRWAWRAPNPLAGYDAYVTEAGVSIALNDKSVVSLHLRSLGYGAALHGVAAGEINGDQQSITIQRGKLREWFVNTPDGLEHGFTLEEPPSSVRQKGLPLRLAMQVNEGWQALADEDGARVFLRNEAGQVIEYGKLVVRDARGVNQPALLTVADEQVVIEVEDHDAQYPLTIDPLFTLQRRFIAFDGRSLDLFGYAVALDGDTAIVGAPGADISTIGGEGAAYIFVRSFTASGATWAQQAKLTAADAMSGDTFGISVALDGNTALVGATHAEPDSLFPSRGGAYVFVRSGSTWTQQQKLNPADGATGVRFGAAVALHENTALVGAPEHKLPGTNAATGAAFVFTRSGTQWTQQSRLRANDAATGDRFGEAVALDADTALIGAPGDDVGVNADQGSAYFFTRNGAAWTQQPRLNTDPGAGDHFGNAVALAGHTAMIGAPLYGGDDRGKVFTFRRNATGWAQTDATEPPQPVTGGNFGVSVSLSGDLAVVGESRGLYGTGADQRSAYVFETSHDPRLVRRLGLELGAANDRFGYAVAVEGNTVIAGAYRANATTTGAAYAYVLHDSRHGERQKLVAADGVANDQFGFAVALDGDTLAVGARNERGGQGAVYVFTRTGTAPNTAWTFQQKIFAADAAADDFFGDSVALDGDTLAVGMPNDDITYQNQGSTYIFTRSSGRWTFQTKLHAADSVGLENFGTAVALDGDTVIVGAPNGKSNPSLSPREGVAYVFTRNGTNWMFQAKLLAPDGEHGDYFGSAVALDGDTAAVGAPADRIIAEVHQGSVYLFTRTGGLWSFRQKVTEGGAIAEFGRSVALAGVVRSGDTLVVGAPGEKIGENNFQGAAYVFKRSGDSWAQTQKLFDRDGASLDRFGYTVAISSDTLVIGAPSDGIGAAFVYTQLDQFWYPQPKLTASDGAAGDYFGWAVAVSGDTIAVGAPSDDSPTQRDQGSVYVFASALCPPLAIAPASLPNGVTGSAYNQQLTGSGGSGVDDYLFSVASGTLPPGLTLTPGTGVLAGTPTVAGTYSFTITTRFGLSLCVGSRTYTLTITSSCATITVNPATLPNGTAGTMYNQTLTASGGAAPYTFTVSTGSLPNGLSLAANGALTGMPTVAGTFNFTAQAGDANGCIGTRAYTVTINPNGGGGNPTGLQFYPLVRPIRLLDTRAGQSGCDAPGAMIAGGTSRTQTAAGRTCSGLTIPANAKALVGNITTVESGGGHLTLYPSDAAQPLVANSNFGPNEILNNVFTVGLGADGAFKIFVTSSTNVVVDITGYYAPPLAGGLYFHPLPRPIRVLETRQGQPGCTTTGVPIQGGFDQAQLATISCNGVTIPSSARAIVGNATSLNSGAGFLTLYPQGASRPFVASSNFTAGQIMNAPFTVALGAMGEFMIFSTTNTDLVVDVMGYYSDQLNDANGVGLLFNPLSAPVRLLETRAGQSGCYTPGAPLAAGSTRQQQARGACGGQTIAATAQAIVGNATVVFPSAVGYLTFWPNGATQPLVATTNFTSGQVFNRHFTVGLGATGLFNIFAASQTDLVIDVSGYFAP